jgi:DNA-3-methyladenine glycosylase II
MIGDLGVQRGVMKWFLAMHAPSYNVSISPERRNKESPTKKPSPESDDNAELLVDKKSDVLPDLSEDPEKQKQLASIMDAATKEFVPAPLPKGLSVSILKTRLQTKKKTKYVL